MVIDILKKMSSAFGTIWGSEAGCTAIIVFLVWLVQTMIVGYIITYHNGGQL